MDEKLIKKMIQNCFLQYSREEDSFAIQEAELEELCKKVIEVQTYEQNDNLYEIVNDIVYEYITK